LILGYYRNVRWRYHDNPPSKYSICVQLFGEAVGDIKGIFLALGSADLKVLLGQYSVLYGDLAGRYACKTFPSWKYGQTKLSGQTMERLIELVPPFLTSEQRFSLLKKVLQKNKPIRPSKSIRINVRKLAEGSAELDLALSSMQYHDVLANLPGKVLKAASWLYANDITAARAMLAEAEKKENGIMLEAAWREVELLKRAIQSKQIRSASYNIQMPAGIISVETYKSFFGF
jgi:hypothetical protein